MHHLHTKKSESGGDSEASDEDRFFNLHDHEGGQCHQRARVVTRFEQKEGGFVIEKGAVRP